MTDTEMSDLERRCVDAVKTAIARHIASSLTATPTETIVRAVIAEARNPDASEWNAAIEAVLARVSHLDVSITQNIRALRKPTPATVDSVRERMLSDDVVDEVTRKMFGNCLLVNCLVARTAITAALDKAGL